MYDRLPEHPLLSVAVMVNVCAVDEVGVPVIWPLAPFKLSPAGKVPLVTAKAYDPLAPLALMI